MTQDFIKKEIARLEAIRTEAQAANDKARYKNANDKINYLQSKVTDNGGKVKLKDIKKGEFFRRKKDAKTTFVKSDYDRSSKKYEAYDFEDVNRFVYLKGTTEVYTGFEF